MDTPKERFFRVYANLPLNLRDHIVLVLDGKTISWNVAYLEIKGNSSFAEPILKELEILKLI